MKKKGKAELNYQTAMIGWSHFDADAAVTVSAPRVKEALELLGPNHLRFQFQQTITSTVTLNDGTKETFVKREVLPMEYRIAHKVLPLAKAFKDPAYRKQMEILAIACPAIVADDKTIACIKGQQIVLLNEEQQAHTTVVNFRGRTLFKPKK